MASKYSILLKSKYNMRNQKSLNIYQIVLYFNKTENPLDNKPQQKNSNDNSQFKTAI